MAIQEFIVEPRQYFAQGYLDQGYFNNNKIRSALVCDAEIVQLAQFSPGVYFVALYMDEGYYQSNDTVFSFTCEAGLLQDVSVSMEAYFEEGYFTGNYYRQQGAEFQVTADVGRLVDNQSPLTVSSTITCLGSRSVDVSSSLSVSVQQQTFASKTNSIDLFALSDAAISAQVSRIRDNNISASTAFDIATDGRVFRDITSAEISEFDITVAVMRSRAANMATQTAFSFDSIVNPIREFSCDLSVLSQSIIQADKVVEVTCNQTVSCSLSVILSNTIGADLILSNFAQVSATPRADKSGQVTLATVSSTNIDGGPVVFFQAGLTAKFARILTRGTKRFERPLQIRTVNATISSEVSRFGGACLRSPKDTGIVYYATALQNEISFEGFIYLESSIQNPFFIQYGNNGGLTTQIGIDAHLRVRKNQDGTWAVSAKRSDGNLMTLTSTLTFNTTDQWIHIAASFNVTTSEATLWVNGTRYVNGTFTNAISLPTSDYALLIGNSGSSVSSDIWVDEVHIQSGGSGFLSSIGRSIGASSITVPTVAKTNTANTNFLGHFDTDFQDDVSVTQLATALLSVSAQQQAQAIKSTSADLALSTVATITASVNSIADAGSSLVVNATQTIVYSNLRPFEVNLVSAFTQVTEIDNFVRAESTQFVLFTPTITVVATRVGEIVLASQFALTAEATSFTDAAADISSAFAVNCSPTVDFQAAGLLQSQTDINLLGGKLQLFQVDVNSALSFTAQAIGFEGTGVGINTVSTLSVTAGRLRVTVSAVSSTFTQTTIGNNNPAPFQISDYEIFCSGWTFSAETAFSSNTPDSGQYLINIAIPKAATNPVPQIVGQITLVNGQGADTIFAPVTYLRRIGTNLYQAYQDERQHSYTTASQTDNLSTGTFRSTGLSTTNINQTTGNFIISLDYDGPKGTQTTSGEIGSPITLRIKGNPNYVMLMSSWFNNPPANTSTLRNVSWQPTGQVYSIPYPIGTSADLRNVTSLIAEAKSIVIPNPAEFSTLTHIAVVGNGLFRGASNQSSTFSTAINAGKNVEISSDLASQSTISVNAGKVTRTSADLNVAAAQSTQNDRLRTSTVALAVTATMSIEAAKTTGFVVNAESAATQSVTAFRIQQGQAVISAFNSQLTAAAKNATGTVLLESAFTQSTQAEKNAVGVIQLAAAFTQSTETADSKTVRVNADIAAEFTQSVEGERIQPAGADLTAQFTLTTNTDQSKIAGVIADFTATVTQSTQAERSRDLISLQASLGTLNCSVDKFRQFSSSLSSVVYDFTASPTFIVRITANFTAFNAQLTVGDVINLDPFLTLTIEPESRWLFILPENRIITIESETRVNTIKE